ncbi:hypothetical protein N8D56_21305 [Devosia sp. A8/3-2]|nr:hypothetical protein N8D56_21305 [Devosia sp. A8/3-2]
MLALSADIAIGGRDNLVIGSLHDGNWFAELEAIPRVDVKNSVVVANHMLRLRRDNADMSVDLTGGWGEGAKTQLEENQGTPCHGIVYSAKSGARTYDGSSGFCNLRAEMVWKVREALDPEGGTDEKLMLPPDPVLEAELTSYRWTPRGTDILIESKEDQKKRIGSSPDRGDTVIQLWHRKDEAVYRAATVGRGREDQHTSVAADEGILEW